MNAKIEMYNDRPTIFIDNVPYPPVIYSLTGCMEGRLSYDKLPNESIRQFVSAGVRLFQLDVWFEDMWFEDGSFDISFALKQMDGLLSADPGAAIFLRLTTVPPKWWNRKYPDECVRYADCEVTEEDPQPITAAYNAHDLKPVYRHSFASKQWLDDCSAITVRFLKELQKYPQSASLAGIHICNGLYGEHHYWAFVNHEPDTSIRMTELFREYTKDPNAHVPGMEERYNPTDGIFRDPVKEKNMIDYITCQHELVADSLIHFCKLVKENWDGDIITGAFYCYYVGLFGRASTGGHLAEEKVLNSPYVDYISAPLAYNRNLRLIGGAGVSRSLIESARLHHKLLLDEMDQPTHIGNIMGGMYTVPLYGSRQILRRNMLSSFLSGMGFWFYDFGPLNKSGWWNGTEFMDDITALIKIMKEYYNRKFVKNADVLLVFDTKVQKYVANNEKQDPVTDRTCINISYPMALRSGASMDTVYLSDLDLCDLDKYKCIVFMNTFLLTDAQKKFIHRKVYKNGRSVIWFFAPGYSDGHTNDIRHIEDVTTFKLKKTEAGTDPVMIFGSYENHFDNKNERTLLKELYVPVDGLPLGYINGEPGMALKEYADYTVYFSALPVTSPDIFRCLFDKCGVHIYDDCNDATLEGSGLLLIHCEHGGARNIRLKDKTVSLDLHDGETVLIDSSSGNVLNRG
jgi:hypothetical protein